MEVLVFRTDINTDENIKDISEQLNSIRGVFKWTVDLEDHEKILRVESRGVTADEVTRAVKDKNYLCEEHPD